MSKLSMHVRVVQERTSIGDETKVVIESKLEVGTPRAVLVLREPQFRGFLLEQILCANFPAEDRYNVNEMNSRINTFTDKNSI